MKAKKAVNNKKMKFYEKKMGKSGEKWGILYIFAHDIN